MHREARVQMLRPCHGLWEAADNCRPRRGTNARVSFGREPHHDASRAESALGYEAASPSSPVKTCVCCFKHCYCVSRSDGAVGSCGLPGQQIDHQLALHLLEAHYLVHSRGMRLCQLENPALFLPEADCSVNMLEFRSARVSEVRDRPKHFLLREGRTRGVSRRFNTVGL